jgi:hypothetical protein
MESLGTRIAKNTAIFCLFFRLYRCLLFSVAGREFAYVSARAEESEEESILATAKMPDPLSSFLFLVRHRLKVYLGSMCTAVLIG